MKRHVASREKLDQCWGRTVQRPVGMPQKEKINCKVWDLKGEIKAGVILGKWICMSWDTGEPPLKLIPGRP